MLFMLAVMSVSTAIAMGLISVIATGTDRTPLTQELNMATERARRAPPPQRSNSARSESELHPLRWTNACLPRSQQVRQMADLTAVLRNQASLEDRIRSALATGDRSINSAELADLCTEVEAAIIAADEAGAGWRQEAENIFNGASSEARDNADTWKLIASRLRGALPKLQLKLVEVGNAEDYASWLVQYEATKAELDAAAAELKAHYPPWASYVCALLAKIKAIDEAVVFVNNSKPQHALGMANSDALTQSSVPPEVLTTSDATDRSSRIWCCQHGNYPSLRRTHLITTARPNSR